MSDSYAASETQTLDTAPPRRKRRLHDRWLTLATFLVILGTWALATGMGPWDPVIRPLFLPSPQRVVETFVQLWNNGFQGRTLMQHVGVSMYRFSVAFFFCIAIGVPLGLLIGMNNRVRAIVEPPIQAIRPIPKIALLPLFLIWFGIGDLSKIIVIGAPVFPIIVISSMQAVRSVSTKKIQAAQSLGANRWTVFARIVMPASLPGIFTGIRVSISIAVTMLVAAELTATSEGIAWMAMTAAEYLATNIVIVAVLIMALIGFTLDRVFWLMESRIVHWAGKD
ncbi:ABC transporter permease [Pararhodobacter sp.]|uniref:ABC transporter permease n=1 Tax=Pararhodobacter sp. TaxID=2127056 RepID=UPI002FDED3C3